jgi:hypothetical protein
MCPEVSSKVCLGSICQSGTQPKVYKFLKHISKNARETARIQGSIDKNVFIQYYERVLSKCIKYLEICFPFFISINKFVMQLAAERLQAVLLIEDTHMSINPLTPNDL